MADRLVQGPDGKMHSFPEDATDLEISAALEATPKANAAHAPKHVRTWTDVAVDALPMIGGAVGGLIGGIGGTVGGMGIGGVPGAVGGAAVGGAGGEGFRQAINTLRGKELPRTTGEAVSDIALQGGVQGAMELGGQMVPRALAAGASSVYRGYLKPSLAKANIGKAQEIVDTALREGLPISGGGIRRAHATIRELSAHVDRLLKQSGDLVDLHQVADKVRAFAKQQYYRPGRASEDFEAAMKVADRIDNHPSLGINPALTKNPGVKTAATDVDMVTANQIKRDLQQGVGPTQYGIPSQAGKTAEKAGAREMRQAIEAKLPGVGPLNARESKLLDAAKAISRAVEREANQSMSHGVKTLVAGGIGAQDYARKGDPYSAVAYGLMARMALSPEVATKIAITASRLAKVHPMAPPQAVRIALAALSEQQNADESQ